MSLAALAGVRLEDGRSVRPFPSYRGQQNYPGWHWVERDLVALDFDPAVTSVDLERARNDGMHEAIELLPRGRGAARGLGHYDAEDIVDTCFEVICECISGSLLCSVLVATTGRYVR